MLRKKTDFILSAKFALIDKGKFETKELLDSLKFKAIESFVTLEKKLFAFFK